jgi:hypothetical protein
MSFLVGPLIQVGSRAGQAAIATGKAAGSLPKANILDDIGKFFSNIIKPVIPAATQITKKAVIPATVTNLVKGVSKNVAIGSGTVLGTTALLSLTQGGQNVVTTTGESVKNITDLGSNVTKLLNNNPLIPIGLLILGGLVLVSVIKK